MENASQALMIAAGLLMGILILSLGVYLFSVFGNSVSTTEKVIAQNMLAQFNEKFLKYEGLTNLTIQDVITVKNYALDNNNSYSGYTDTSVADGTNDYVDVFLGGSSILNRADDVLLREELEKYTHVDDKPRYKCQSILTSPHTGKVYQIIFRVI